MIASKTANFGQKEGSGGCKDEKTFKKEQKVVARLLGLAILPIRHRNRSG